MVSAWLLCGSSQGFRGCAVKAPWLFYCCAVVAPELLVSRSVNALLLGGSSAVAGWSVVTLWSLSGCSGVFLQLLGSVIVLWLLVGCSVF